MRSYQCTVPQFLVAESTIVEYDRRGGTQFGGHVEILQRLHMLPKVHPEAATAHKTAVNKDIKREGRS